MKRTIKQAIFIATLIFSVFLSSCFNPVITMIREEVDLEDAVINGNINSIVRYTGQYGSGYGDYLFMQNGYIAYKSSASEKQTHGEWQDAPYVPPVLEYDDYLDTFYGTQIIKLAVGGDNSGNNTLFALGINYKTDTGSTVPADKILYKLTNENPHWKEIYRRPVNIPENSNFTQFEDNFTIFCTNSPNPAHRRAFARIGTGENRLTQKYFELTQGTDWSDKSKLDDYGVPIESTIVSTSETYNSVVFINGKVFFTSGVGGTNETASTPATYAYWSNGEMFHWCEAGSISDKLEPQGSIKVAANLYSMAVNKDSIIVGPYRLTVQRIGIEKTGKPTEIINFETNITSQLRNPYTTNVLFALDPAKNEKDNVIYAALVLSGSEGATSGSIQSVGLWSYYPSRGNWNRE